MIKGLSALCRFTALAFVGVCLTLFFLVTYPLHKKASQDWFQEMDRIIEGFN